MEEVMNDDYGDLFTKQKFSVKGKKPQLYTEVHVNNIQGRFNLFHLLLKTDCSLLGKTGWDVFQSFVVRRIKKTKTEEPKL